jgi:hypothetical protein
VQVKLLTTVTGHGFDNATSCAEFCPNIHSLKVNGDILRSWDIIQPCGSNPLYPQGGTWLYDRAGWCPGMMATTNEFELTDYIHNNSINFDYDVTHDPYGSYRTAIYLVTYGNINQTDDASAEMIIAPTDNSLQLRYNPTCGRPIVVIKNIGSNPLNTVDIEYGFSNGTVYRYAWQGNLNFLENDTIMLPAPDWNEATASTGTFRFDLLNPNGKTDPTPYNNQLTSTFRMSPIVAVNDIQIYLRTNNDPGETSWKLYSIDGEVLYENAPDLEANTIYRTDVHLENNSYLFSLYDSGGDGLEFWVNIQYGGGTAGNASLKRIIPGRNPLTYPIFHSFEADFGTFSQFYFAVNQYATKIKDNEVKNITIFPNPAQSYIYVDLVNIAGKNLSAAIYDLSGKVILSVPVSQLQLNKIEIEHLLQGTYIINIKDNSKQIAQSKFIIKNR